MLIHGRPRYWIDWYDRWHWPLVALLAGLVAAAWFYPAATTELFRPALARPPARPAAVLPLTPTILDSPRHGTGFLRNRPADAEGRAAPGSTVLLEYQRPDGGWTELGRMPVDATGHFRFALRDFPVGGFRLRARAFLSDGRSNSSAEIMFTVVADPVRERTPRRRK